MLQMFQTIIAALGVWGFGNGKVVSLVQMQFDCFQCFLYVFVVLLQSLHPPRLSEVGF